MEILILKILEKSRLKIQLWVPLQDGYKVLALISVSMYISRCFLYIYQSYQLATAYFSNADEVIFPPDSSQQWYY